MRLFLTSEALNWNKVKMLQLAFGLSSGMANGCIKTAATYKPKPVEKGNRTDE